MLNNNLIAKQTEDFALRIIGLYKYLQNEKHDHQYKMI